jgi:anoctamin-8
VLFFSGVFPLAPLIALVNNLALIRLGALKLCYTRQRPVAQKASGIGVWEDVLQVPRQ